MNKVAPPDLPGTLASWSIEQLDEAYTALFTAMEDSVVVSQLSELQEHAKPDDIGEQVYQWSPGYWLVEKPLFLGVDYKNLSYPDVEKRQGEEVFEITPAVVDEIMQNSKMWKAFSLIEDSDARDLESSLFDAVSQYQDSFVGGEGNSSTARITQNVKKIQDVLSVENWNDGISNSYRNSFVSNLGEVPNAHLTAAVRLYEAIVAYRKTVDVAKNSIYQLLIDCINALYRTIEIETNEPIGVIKVIDNINDSLGNNFKESATLISTAVLDTLMFNEVEIAISSDDPAEVYEYYEQILRDYLDNTFRELSILNDQIKSIMNDWSEMKASDLCYPTVDESL